MSIISIENLSNELFCQIFDYLDSIHIYQSFSNLNHRFEQLLISAYVRYKLYLYPKSNDFELYISICKKLMIHHHDQIDSVFVNNLSDDEDCLQFSSFISSFKITYPGEAILAAGFRS